MKNSHVLSRSEFLKLVASGLGGVVLACRKSSSASPTIVPPSPAALATQATASFADGTLADMVLANGIVHTIDDLNTISQAVAVSGDRILAVGTTEDMLALAGPNAQIYDLEGRAITPGLIDPHLHFRGYGLMTSYYTGFNPPDVVNIADLQSMLADVIKTSLPGEWINGYYMVLADKPIPTKEDLDPISPNNPVFMMHIGGHWGTANTAALQAAGVTSKTRNPEGGIIEMRDGQPTGVFFNHRAMDVLRQAAPPITDDLVRQSIIDTQVLMASCGVTCFHDNNIRDVESVRAYQDLSQSGDLFLRNNLYLTLEYPNDIRKVDQVDFLQNDTTRFLGYKFLIDGQGPTAFTHQPHTGHEWQMPTWEESSFIDTVRSLHDTGLQICVHCIGDAATDLVLDAYQSAINTNPRSDPRHRLEHAVLTAPESTTRMRDLGVVVSTQPAFIYLFGDGWQGLFGAERMSRIMVTREWLESGVHLAIGSDAPSTPYYYPQASLAGAMTRYTFKNTPIAPEQGLEFNQALRAHTIEGAYAAHQEQVLGSIEKGKFADLVVWPSDPAALTIQQLGATKTVDMTFVGGRLVHQA